MKITELRPGLHRWTADHPEAAASPQAGSPADWGPAVGSVAYEAADALLLVDPLVPDEGWEALDALVERHGRRVAVITTLQFHRRSRDAVAERYGASTSRARDTLPAGVETIRVAGAGETMVWLPGPGALVPGDRLLGDDAGGLRLCPESWLRYLPSRMTRAQLAEELRPLLDLPIELVLVSHGEPVLARGREAVARAIDSA
jgi:glyoxylase-like metal-dependent hydrolase (beta-lactamase superfamily II)